MYKEIKKVKKPMYLIITPLRPGDKISKLTKKTVKKNNMPLFDWVVYEADNNIPTNTTLALEQYRYKHGDVKYIIKIDNDIDMSKGLLDNMYRLISGSADDVGYVYCDFSFIHELGMKTSFSKEFDVNSLLQHNYISSNSMIKLDVLDKVGGFVKDSKYERLLDWALWLRFLYHGYRGVRLRTSGFESPLNKDNVSARGHNDYQIKRQRILQDFVSSIVEKYKSN